MQEALFDAQVYVAPDEAVVKARRGEIERLLDALKRFNAERDWVRFHTPRNLAMALAGEVGELLAELQWRSDDDVGRLGPAERAAIESEVADVAIYLFL